MNIIDTSAIPSFPEHLTLGELTIQEFEVDSTSYVNPNFLDDITNAQRKKEYITSRVLFDRMVQHLGWTDVILSKEPLGKPFIEIEGVRKYVSFTHSKSRVFCAISESLDIGLDCERSDRIVNNRVVKRILSTQEWTVLGEEDPITLWTVKEAAVKSLGTGLRTNLKEIELKKKSDGYFEIQINDERRMEGICFRYLEHHVSLAW